MIRMNIIQHPYMVCLKDNETLCLENLSETESCIEYAKKHIFNVLLTKTSSASTAEAVAMFIQAGVYKLVEEENDIAPDGTPVTPDIHFLFIHPEKKNNK